MQTLARERPIATLALRLIYWAIYLRGDMLPVPAAFEA